MTNLPTDIRDALAMNAEAACVLEHLPPSHRRAYPRRVEKRKKPETRSKRIGGMLERLTAPRGA